MLNDLNCIIQAVSARTGFIRSVININVKDPSAIWNGPFADYPRHRPLHEWIEDKAALQPEKIAVIFGGDFITYAQLNGAANQLAGFLLSSGVGGGDVVGLLADRSPQMLVSLIAILKAGAAYIPLDPEYPEQRISYMLENAAAKAVLAEKKYEGGFSYATRVFILEEALQLAATYSTQDIRLTVTGNDLAYIIYTSGSTGRPKGVMIEHANVVNLLLHLRDKGIIQSHDKLLAITTISFDIAVLELFLPLIAGAQVVLTESKVSRDGFALLELVRREQISIMQATPVTWRIMLAAGWEERADLTILCCGEALPMDLAAKLLPRCRRLFNYYGPTETTIYSTGTEILSTDTVITIGYPVANTQVYILDETMKPLPPGAAGELYIGGDGVGRGYVHMPGLTAERFVDDPFSKQAPCKLFRTGDLGKWMDDGKIYLMGRIDQQIKIRGYRIEPGEIEACLLSEPGVNDAVVIAREDMPGNQQLVAYIIPSNITADHTEDIQQWKKKIQQCVPDFMVPHEYVVMPAFPLLPNGKVNRKELPKPGRRPHMPVDTNGERNTGIEKMIARIWAEVLDMDEVGVDENFFDLGGHSLIAVQIMARLERATGKRLPIAALFEAPTVRQLSYYLESGDIPSLWEALVPIKPHGSKPPLYIVHGDGLNVMVFNSIPKYMDADQPLFGLQPKGLNGVDMPDESMEEIAAYYIAGILEHNPHGPYFLAGYSFGGIVAFEMAKQLEAKGHKVKLLAMFDTNVGNIQYAGPFMQRLLKKIGLQLPKLLFIANSLVKYPRNVIEYQWFVAKRKWQSLLAKTGIGTTAETDQVPLHERQIIEKHLSAYKNYRMTPYAGKIDLFRVQQRVYFLDDPVYLGWKRMAKSGVAIHQVPGDHRTFLLPPNDKVFAEMLQSVIDERSKE